KIEGGEIPLSLELIDLQEILREVIHLQSVQIHQKGLRLTVPDVTQPIWVRADPARLKQVLLNIVYNAIKFTDQGGVTIATRAERATQNSDTPAQDGWVIVSVQDTGIGIDPTQQHKLFRPFVMVDGTTTLKHEGTGLGLAISRNLLELMGGSISLHSAGVGQGTTVEIALPLASSGESIGAVSSPQSDRPAPKKHPAVSS
ncbi:MAG: two-component sensor histidine kinase, partial [Microcoleus sp. SIO2G3]|nr:two-component sensor histidine kinase [Microcoleus sp. SIO2G3]